VICTAATCRRFQIGSKMLLPNRNARMLYRLLAQVMVDAIDLAFLQHA